MLRILKNVLRVVVPRWVLDDFEARLTHPYWRRKVVPSAKGSTLVDTIGIAGKLEATSHRSPFKRINEKHVMEALRRDGSKWILDVGCGSGNLVRYLESKNFEAFGITINPEEVKLANHPRVSLLDIQSDISNSALKRITFDCVLSFDCLEHLVMPLSALRNINRLLRPDGLFISYIPPARWIECDYHIIVYTPRQFRWLLNLTGFDLEHKEGGYYFKKRGTTYFARKKSSDRMVYRGVL